MQGLTPPIGHTCYSAHQKHLLHSGFITWCTHYRLTNLVFTIHSSSGITFSSKNETVSLDNNKVSKGEDPPPVGGYEKMEALNPLPLPPKSPFEKTTKQVEHCTIECRFDSVLQTPCWDQASAPRCSKVGTKTTTTAATSF